MGIVNKSFSEIITFTRSSNATYFDSAGVLRTATSNVSRIDYNPSTLAAQGMLVEEQRTNSIRNNTMVGAVAGTPGTAPTNWSVTAGAGLSSEVIGTGTESGITYIDIRIFGTTAGSVSIDIVFEPAASVTALTGQTWTEAIYQKLAGGTLTNISSFVFRFNEFTSGGVSISGQNSSSLAVPTSSGLATQRVNGTVTLNGGATTAQLLAFLRIITGTGAVDLTLRIGMPQLELGAFATSVISTSSAAATRSADVASVNTLSPWYNAAAGTLFAQYSSIGISGTQYIAAMDNGAGFADSCILYMVSSGFPRWDVFVSSSSQAALTPSPGTAISANTLIKLSGAYLVNDFASSRNGGAVSTDTSGTVPTLSRLTLGNSNLTTSFLNGHIQRIVYYPRRLTNAELQAITT